MTRRYRIVPSQLKPGTFRVLDLARGGLVIGSGCPSIAEAMGAIATYAIIGGHYLPPVLQSPGRVSGRSGGVIIVDDLPRASDFNLLARAVADFRASARRAIKEAVEKFGRGIK